MGGGDLNMKKSWHPLLLKNQERVWLEEKKALEEKKKLDQLRKEKEEERQLQELQRLQEEQTGKKRTEKLEWMYTTPATGSNQNPNDLEDYLLGKKRVDKILTADDNVKLGASHKSFIAVQNANTARDIASKIREDPFFAMKQQEQAAYQALISNPLRLRELQERNGIKPKKSKEKKRDKRGEGRGGRYAGDSKRQRSLSPVNDGAKHSRMTPPHSRSHPATSASKPTNDTGDRAVRGQGGRYAGDSRGRQRSRSPVSDDTRRSRLTPPPHSRSHPADSASKPTNDTGDRAVRGEGRRGRYTGDSRKRQRSPSPVSDGARRSRLTPPYSRSRPVTSASKPTNDTGDCAARGEGGGGRYAGDSRKRQRSSSPVSDGARRSRMTPPHSRSHPANSASKPTNGTGDRAARLAAMQSNASTVEFDRQKRLLQLLAKEKAELEAENEVRSKSQGMGGFLSQEQKKVFGGEGGLEDRIRRGRGGLVVDAD